MTMATKKCLTIFQEGGGLHFFDICEEVNKFMIITLITLIFIIDAIIHSPPRVWLVSGIQDNFFFDQMTNRALLLTKKTT